MFLKINDPCFTPYTYTAYSLFMRLSRIPWLLKFLSQLLLFQRLRVSSFHSTSSFELKKSNFWLSECTSFLLDRKPVQRNYRVCALRFTETKITSENAFNRNCFGLKVAMNKEMTTNLFLGYICRFVTGALIVRPGNTYICVFEAFFGSCKF